MGHEGMQNLKRLLKTEVNSKHTAQNSTFSLVQLTCLCFRIGPSQSKYGTVLKKTVRPILSSLISASFAYGCYRLHYMTLS